MKKNMSKEKKLPPDPRLREREKMLAKSARAPSWRTQVTDVEEVLHHRLPHLQKGRAHHQKEAQILILHLHPVLAHQTLLALRRKYPGNPFPTLILKFWHSQSPDARFSQDSTRQLSFAIQVSYVPSRT